MTAKILVIEDDEAIREPLVDFLEGQGYQVTEAARGMDGLRLAMQGPFDLLLLDLMLPDIQGLDICKKLREHDFSAPIIILTALGDEIDRVLGLEMGADDYVSKPFGVREIHARIRAHLRREQRTKQQQVQHQQSAPVYFQDIIVDRRAMRVYRSEKPIKLSTMEFKLLCYFLDHPKRALSRDELLERVWGFDQMPTTRTVDTHILQLRKKVGPYFATVHGVGYLFEENLQTKDS